MENGLYLEPARRQQWGLCVLGNAMVPPRQAAGEEELAQCFSSQLSGPESEAEGSQPAACGKTSWAQIQRHPLLTLNLCLEQSLRTKKHPIFSVYPNPTYMTQGKLRPSGRST